MSRNPEGSLNYLLSLIARSMLDELYSTEDGRRVNQGFTESQGWLLSRSLSYLIKDRRNVKKITLHHQCQLRKMA